MNGNSTPGALLPLMPPMTEEEARLNARAHGRQYGAFGVFRREFLLMLLFFVVIPGAVLVFETRDLPFDAGQWKSSGASSGWLLPATRERMCNDLIKNKLLGLDQAQVVALLGEPDPGSSHTQFIYSVGSRGIDPVTLMIQFNRDSRVNFLDLHYSS